MGSRHRRRFVLPAALLAVTALGPLAGHGFGQEWKSSLPPWPASLAEYAGLSEGARDSWVLAHRSELSDLVHRSLLAAVRARLGEPEDGAPAGSETVAADIAARAARIGGIDAFAIETARVLSWDDPLLRARDRAATGAWNALLETQAIAADPARPDEFGPACARVAGQAEILAAWSAKHDDRDLLRAAAQIRAWAVRARPGRTAVEAFADRSKSLEDLAALYARHGLESDRRYLLAEVDLAALYLRHRRFSEAGAATLAARRSLGERPLPPDQEAQLLSAEVEIHRERGSHAAAGATLQKLRDLLPALREEAARLQKREVYRLVGDYHFQVAAHLGWNGAHREAAALLRQALALPMQRGGQIVRDRLQLAKGAEISGDPVEAGALADEVIEAVPGLDPASEEAPLAPLLDLDARLVAARTALDRGQRDRGWQILQEAFARAGKIADVPAEIRAALFLASSRFAVWDGDLESALEATAGALAALAARQGATERIQALTLRTKVFLAMGEEREAMVAAHETLAAAEEAVFERDAQEYAARVLLSQVLLSARRAGEALVGLDAALATRGAFLDERPFLRAQAERLRTEARWQLWTASVRKPRDLERLLADAREAIAGLQSLGRGRAGSAEAAIEILRDWELVQGIEIASGIDPSGERALESARAWWMSLGPRDLGAPTTPLAEAEAVMNLLEGRHLECIGRRDDAVAKLRNAAALEDRLRSSLRYRAPDGLSARFESIHDRIASLLCESAAELRDPARAREALLFLEEVRAGSLRTLVAAAGARNRQRAPKDGESGVAHLRSPLVKPPRLTEDQLDALLPADRAVAVFAVTGRGAWVIGARGGRIAVERIALDRPAIERQVHGLLQNLQGGPDPYKADAVLDYGHELSRQLLGPVAHLLNGARELVVVPDGILNVLPWAALVEKPCAAPPGLRSFADVPFLIRREGLESLAQVPSLQTLALLQGRPEAEPARSALLVGDPALGDAGLPPLPAARREVRTIGGLFPEGETTLLEGAAATRSAFEASRPGDFGILHLATHARRPGRTGATVSLLFAPEASGGDVEEFGAADAAALPLAETRLVVLSACVSGLGRHAFSEGLFGLPRGFLLAGARSVLATRTHVSDDHTTALMGHFYSAMLRERRSPSRSLVGAMRTLLASPLTSWPGYWSPFFVVGAP